MDSFIVIPTSMMTDSRLSLRQIRVLMALYSHRNPRSTNVVFPSRARLSALTGYPETRISTITSELSDAGWLTKKGNGGRSRAAEYDLTETVTETVTVTNPVTVTESVTPEAQTVPNPVTVSGRNGNQNGNGHRIKKSINNISSIDPDFEQAWAAVGRYGTKAVALRAWKRCTPDQRLEIVAAIPDYMRCIAAGRWQKQFEGWINPDNRLWKQDWKRVLTEMEARQKPADPKVAAFDREMASRNRREADRLKSELASLDAAIRDPFDPSDVPGLRRMRDSVIARLVQKEQE